MAQPPLSSHDGVILSIGLLSNNERWEIVMPVAHNDAGLDETTMCKDAVKAFALGAPEANLLNCLSVDTSIIFRQAVGMVPGAIPYREDVAPTTVPGNVAGSPVPTSVAALIAFYAVPADLPSPGRMRVAKQFVSGFSLADILGDGITVGEITVLETFADSLLNGFTTFIAGGNWYRVNSAVDTDITPLIRNFSRVVREYVATQRRRLLPH